MKHILSILLLLLTTALTAQRIIPRPRPIPRPTVPQTWRNQPLQTKEIKIQATMNHHIAKVKMAQTFHNPTNRRIEGMYLFPVPKGMTIHNFSMEIDGKPVNAELLDANKARKIYEDIVRRQVDPALMEYQDGGMIKLRIFPIEPQADRKIVLEFETELNHDSKLSGLELPLPKTKIGQLILDFRIETTDAIGNIICPTHEIDIAYQAQNKAHVSSEVKNIEGKGKLQFLFGRKAGKIEADLMVYKDLDDNQFFQLSLSPGFSTGEEIVGKDINFVIDVSGSMRGEKLDQAKKALKFCVKNLNAQDKFNIIRFSTEAAPLFQERKEASAKNIEYANNWINNLKAAGGTNIYDALQLSLAETPNISRPEMTVFITDGRPTIGNTLPVDIIKMVDRKLSENRRIFTFGIGDDLNIKLLDMLTDHSNGFRTYVSEHEDIAFKVSSFYRKVASPVLTNLSIKTSKNLIFSDLQPKTIPDLFGGSTLLLFGKYTRKGKLSITLSGKVNGKEKQFEYSFNPKSLPKNDFIPRLWATRKVAYLYDQIRLNGEDKELKDEIIATAKKYGIITPFTSFLLIENEADLLRHGQIGMEEVIWNQPTRRLPRKRAQTAADSRAESYSVQQKRLSTNTSITISENRQLAYEDRYGNQRNLAEEVQYTSGRAFYLQNNVWIDANYLAKADKKIKEQKIIYGSKAYFTLLAQKEMQQYLTLGTNVVFVHDNVRYSVLD